MPPKSDDPDRLQLKPYLSVLHARDGLRVGIMPPRAVTLTAPPPALAPLLQFLISPRTTAEAVEFLQGHEIPEAEAEGIIEDLDRLGVVGPPLIDPAERYSRHRLYYDMIGLDADAAQDALGAATVGLIGMGGIGSITASILAAAGIGHLVVADADVVEDSNLTRQVLYGESCVGAAKVHAAARQLRNVNASTRVTPVQEALSGPDLVLDHFGACDFIILSADKPTNIHDWLDDAACQLGVAYSNAGYIEAQGAVGPLVQPGSTPCYLCLRDQSLPAWAIHGTEDLNASCQAPSYGPLNFLVSSLQANETIRYLLGLTARTRATALLIDSQTYEVVEVPFTRDAACPRCAHLPMRDARADADT